MARKRFPDLSTDAFMSEADRKALDGLRKVPLLPQLISKFHEAGIDRWMYCHNMSMSVRCGPKQYGSLYKILQECCKILDVPEPELYVSSHPFPNAFAGGVERPYIVVRSSMIDTLSDEELYYLIGHELGHIKAGHLLYKTVAVVLLPLFTLINRRFMGLGDAAQIAVVAAFYEWQRQAEITCDRAGLLCTQDFDTCALALLNLTAGPNRMGDEGSVESFLDQARAYQDMDLMDGIGKLLIFLYYGKTATHPMPVHRLQMLERWYQAGELDKILKGNYAKVKQESAS